MLQYINLDVYIDFYGCLFFSPFPKVSSPGRPALGSTCLACLWPKQGANGNRWEL